jgi:HK97 family phage major capsid protein
MSPVDAAVLERRIRQTAAADGAPLDLIVEDLRHRALEGTGRAEATLLDGNRLRTTLDSTTGVGLIAEDPKARVVASTPRPVMLPGLVRTELADGLRVHRSRLTSFTGTAAVTSDGAALPALTSLQVPDTEDLTLRHFGVTADVTRGHLEDGPLFRQTVESLMRRAFGAGLEAFISADIIASITATPLGTDTQLDALSKAVEALQSNGFAYPTDQGPSAYALLAPGDLGKIRRQKTSQGDYILAADGPLADVVLLPCASLTTGTVLVGDFREASALWLHRPGVQLDLAPSNGTNFLDGIVTMRLSAWLAHKVVQPAAAVVISGF